MPSAGQSSLCSGNNKDVDEPSEAQADFHKDPNGAGARNVHDGAFEDLPEAQAPKDPSPLGICHHQHVIALSFGSWATELGQQSPVTDFDRPVHRPVRRHSAAVTPRALAQLVLFGGRGPPVPDMGSSVEDDVSTLRRSGSARFPAGCGAVAEWPIAIDVGEAPSRRLTETGRACPYLSAGSNPVGTATDLDLGRRTGALVGPGPQTLVAWAPRPRAVGHRRVPGSHPRDPAVRPGGAGQLVADVGCDRQRRCQYRHRSCSARGRAGLTR